MTLKEKVICEAYTGICFCTGEDRNELYKYLAEKMGRPVYSHEFATNFEKIRDISREDFVKVCKGDYSETPKEIVIDSREDFIRYCRGEYGDTSNQSQTNLYEFVRKGEWIPVTPETLPKAEEKVLVMCRTYSGGRYVCCAFYVPAGMSRDDSDYCWDIECCDYSDDEDEYYVREGWYEKIHNWDEYQAVGIEDFVTHWMPIPEGEQR